MAFLDNLHQVWGHFFEMFNVWCDDQLPSKGVEISSKQKDDEMDILGKKLCKLEKAISYKTVGPGDERVANSAEHVEYLLELHEKDPDSARKYVTSHLSCVFDVMKNDEEATMNESEFAKVCEIFGNSTEAGISVFKVISGGDDTITLSLCAEFWTYVLLNVMEVGCENNST